MTWAFVKLLFEQVEQRLTVEDLRSVIAIVQSAIHSEP